MWLSWDFLFVPVLEKIRVSQRNNLTCQHLMCLFDLSFSLRSESSHVWLSLTCSSKTKALLRFLKHFIKMLLSCERIQLIFDYIFPNSPCEWVCTVFTVGIAEKFHERLKFSYAMPKMSVIRLVVLLEFLLRSLWLDMNLWLSHDKQQFTKVFT